MSIELLLQVKKLHITCVALSLLGFLIRGLWMIRGSALLQSTWVKIIPHINDSILLGSAITLAIGFQFSPLNHPWLAAKIIALVIYIGLGDIALKASPSRKQSTRVIAWILALFTFIFIIGCAYTKTPISWLSLF